MRILKLTPALEKNLLRARHERDREAETIASKIIADVRQRGDAALFAYTKKFDHLDLRPNNVWISASPSRGTASRARLRPNPIPANPQQSSAVSSAFLRAIAQAAQNIRRIAQKQLPLPWSVQVEPGVTISQRVSPIDSVACYIPGGNFALVSTLLMTAIPAQVAGVPQITVVCPKPNAALLAAANFLGIPQIAQIGGAQAIAALAYGTASIPRVEKICGPGNRFVTAAKQLVSSDCAIDLPAGPTEAIVLAASGNAKFIAADLLAQAEHALDAVSFLVTTSATLAREVQREIEWQANETPHALSAKIATTINGRILLAPSLAAACDFVNRFAPEHLSLPTQPDQLLKKITASGTIFLGLWAAQPLGDYVSGSNHVLPTAGWARKRAGLSSADFVKLITTQSISRPGFQRLADAAESLAESEGLLAHRNAIRIRR
jgi:histidinol dehydrogenase